MNFEKMNALSQKVEALLGVLRTLKEDNTKLHQQLKASQAEVQDKTMLLETANANLVDCKAALEARANQVSAQDGTIESLNGQINEKLVSIANLTEQVNNLNGVIASKDSELAAKQGEIDSLNSQLAEKNGMIDSLNGQLGEQNSIIESLNGQIEGLKNQTQDQANEFAQAQEQFNNLLSTIENELGEPLQVAPVETASQEEPASESQVIQEEVQEEPQEDLPTIEVHGANENNGDMSSAGPEGRQTSFFD